jgi:hypothetical protein
VDREHILAEIHRTTEENGGIPLGVLRFAAETGIHPHDWSGRYWARWNDALAEAGLPPNELKRRYVDDEVLARLPAEVRRLGRMPTDRELRLLRSQDATFPSAQVFQRIGTKAVLANKLAEYCGGRPECADVLELLTPLLDETREQEAAGEAALNTAPNGFVYMIKSGHYYKIGLTKDVGRRTYDLAIQLPEIATQVHVIATDDPAGIERYWHDRFADRRKNGEWFELSKQDVAAFKRRKFM